MKTNVHCDHISLNSSQNEKYFTENCKTQFYVEYFFLENRAFYEIMWKNMV
jgi:hypothetical protein